MTKHKEMNKEVAFLLEDNTTNWEVNIARKEATYIKNNLSVSLTYYTSTFSMGRVNGIAFDVNWKNTRKLGKIVMPKVISSLDDSAETLKGYRTHQGTY